MSFATTKQDESTIIRVPSRFDFSLMRDFNGTIDGIIDQASADKIVVDFHQTDYLDSAALGMLLVLRDRARSSGKSVVLAGARGTVGEVLKIANFGKLFAFR